MWRRLAAAAVSKDARDCCVDFPRVEEPEGELVVDIYIVQQSNNGAVLSRPLRSLLYRETRGPTPNGADQAQRATCDNVDGSREAERKSRINSSTGLVCN